MYIRVLNIKLQFPILIHVQINIRNKKYNIHLKQYNVGNLMHIEIYLQL